MADNRQAARVDLLALVLFLAGLAVSLAVLSYEPAWNSSDAARLNQAMFSATQVTGSRRSFTSRWAAPFMSCWPPGSCSCSSW